MDIFQHVQKENLSPTMLLCREAAGDVFNMDVIEQAALKMHAGGKRCQQILANE